MPAAAVVEIEEAAGSEGLGALWLGKRVRIDGEPGTDVVRFIGKTAITDGTRLGIEMDAAVGKHDGAVNGIRCFQCPRERGLLVSASSGKTKAVPRAPVTEAERAALIYLSSRVAPSMRSYRTHVSEETAEVLQGVLSYVSCCVSRRCSTFRGVRVEKHTTLHTPVFFALCTQPDVCFLRPPRPKNPVGLGGRPWERRLPFSV